jgi:pilus assembly protein Flp/PilA
MNRIRTALRRDDGASAVEYGLIIAMIAAVLVAVIFTLGVLTKGKFSQACTSWNAADGTTSSC